MTGKTLKVSDFFEAHSDSIRFETNKIIGFSSREEEEKIQTLIFAVFFGTGNEIESGICYGTPLIEGNKYTVLSNGESRRGHDEEPLIHLLCSNTQEHIYINTLSFLNAFAHCEFPD